MPIAAEAASQNSRRRVSPLALVFALGVLLALGDIWWWLQSGIEIRPEASWRWRYQSRVWLLQRDPHPNAQPASWREMGRAYQAGPVTVLWPGSLLSGSRKGTRLRMLMQQAERELFEELDLVRATQTCEELGREQAGVFPTDLSLRPQLLQSRVQAAGGYYQAASGDFGYLFAAMFRPNELDTRWGKRNAIWAWLGGRASDKEKETRLRAVVTKGTNIPNSGPPVKEAAVQQAVRAEAALALGEWVWRQEGRWQEVARLFQQVLATASLPENDDCKRLARAYLAYIAAKKVELEAWKRSHP